MLQTSWLLFLCNWCWERLFSCIEKWYKKADDLGRTDGLISIGLIHKNGYLGDGIGVNQFFDKSFKCYQKVARRGISKALVLIGNMYENKKGYKRDYPIAMSYYQKAADLGNSDAFNAIGN